MITRSKRLVFSLLLLFAGTLVVMPTVVSAQFDPLEETCKSTPQATVCQDRQNDTDPITGSDSVLMRIIGILTMVVAVISIIIIIVAGMTMTLSSGDSGKVQSSRNAIIYAAVGLVVVALARSIVVFVVNRVE